MGVSGSKPPVGLLGPVTVDVDGNPAPITSGRARTLLVALALAHPHPVGAARLAESVWPEHAPQNPSGALQTQVSRLRRILGPDSIAGSAAGYRLTTDFPVSDLAVAEEFLRTDASADTSGAARLRTWWRGEPGTDLPAGEIRDELTERADRAAHALRERDWHGRLTREPGQVAAEIAELRSAASLDEHLAALHMRALLQAGDPNAALAVHAGLATGLAEALGADPGPEVAAAHSAALAYSPLPHTPAPPADAYVGGTSALDDLADALTASAVVTVTGPGGIGKTRLVTEYIAAHRPTNVFVDLSTARQADDTLAAVAVALGRGAVPDRSVSLRPQPHTAGAAVAQLAPPDTIVVLDTCEHLPGAVADIITEIRARRSDIRVIATSRTPLDLPGEHLVTPAPLSGPAAAELLTRRARRVRGDVHLEPGLVTELCTRLDGSPLALELAAAQLRYLSLADIVGRLDARFGLLAVPGEGRHHALSDVIAASWELLDDRGRRALTVLSVFPGDVRIQDVLTFDGVTVEGLAQICDHSLASVIEGDDGLTRYRLTETVRDFTRTRTGRERTTLDGEFVCWAVDLLESLGTGLLAGEVVGVVARLDESSDALLAALHSAADGHGPRGSVARLLPVITWRVIRTGGYPDAERLALVAIDDAVGSECCVGIACATAYLILLIQPRAAARARARLRHLAAGATLPPVIALIVHLLTASPADFTRIVTRATRSRDPLVVAVAEIIRSDSAEFLAAPTLSKRAALRALVAAERTRHPWLITTSRHRLGRGHSLLGDHAGAAVHLGRAAADFAALGLAEDACQVRVHQALAVLRSDPDLAGELLDSCLREAGDSGRAYVATAHMARAQLRAAVDPSGARRAADTAIAVIGPPHDGHSAYLHGVRAAILYVTGAGTEARLAAEGLRVALGWLAMMPTPNLPALGAAAAAIGMVTGLDADDPLLVAARGARYRRDFPVVDAGRGPSSHRAALLSLLR